MVIKTFEDIIAWQKSRDLYIGLYREAMLNRDFSFKDQLLRAVLSISNNIAEGFDRGTNKELRQFLIISRGSCAEARSMLLLASEMGLFSVQQQQSYLATTKDIARLLTKFIKSLSIQNTDNRIRTTTR